jgi:hypothetical protein
MFVSTYSTYLNANSVNKATRDADNSASTKPSKLFENSLANSELPSKKLLQNGPVNYLSYNKVSSTKERINEQLKQNSYESSIKKFTDVSSQMKAPSAYAANTKMFSLMLKEQQTLKGAEPINKELPKEIQALKESNLRLKMISTYMQNDRYYQITA